MGINGGTGIVGSGAALGGSGIHINRGGGGGFDPDAQAFIDAVGADATISEYINTMFLGMKGEGTTNGTNFYSKLYAVYPMAPSDASTISLSTIKWNAVNPLDTDAAFRLTFVNEPTADLALGLNNNATPNGYAETHFVDTDEFTAGNNGLTAYVTRRVSGNGYPIAAGASLAIRNNASNAFEARSSGAIISGSVISEGDILSQSRRSATDFESYINSVSEGNNATSASGQTLIQLYLMARFFINPRDFLNGAVGFVAIHDGLTDQETQDLYDVINTWNTNLGR